MNVSEELGIDGRDGLFGIEIEVEGKNLPPAVSNEWKIERDASLRGESAEYVLKNPLNKEEAINAIINLKESLSKSKLTFSHRTSVHVHVNIGNLTRNQLIRFAFLSSFLDSVLYEYAGREVSGNRFCLRLVDAYGGVDHLTKLLTEKRIIIPDKEAGKYSAVNICPINSYGSIEFRMLAGTLAVRRLTNWLSMLELILDYSKRFSTIKQMMENFHNNEVNFIRGIFGERLSKLLITENTIDLLRVNYSLLIHLVYETFYRDEPVNKPFAKMEDEEIIEWIKKEPRIDLDELPQGNPIAWRPA